MTKDLFSKIFMEEVHQFTVDTNVDNWTEMKSKFNKLIIEVDKAYEVYQLENGKKENK